MPAPDREKRRHCDINKIARPDIRDNGHFFVLDTTIDTGEVFAARRAWKQGAVSMLCVWVTRVSRDVIDRPRRLVGEL